MMKLILTVFLFSFSFFIKAQVYRSVIAKDFLVITGNWEGTLTYLDYSTGKPFTMPANCKVREAANAQQFILENIYPKEPHANNKDTITISVDGNYLNNEKITSRKKPKTGVVELVTKIKGTDGNDNRLAIIKHTYTLSNDTFIIKKEIQFLGEETWIKRNEYNYRRSDVKN